MMDDKFVRLRARQDRLGSPLYPWTITDAEVWRLLRRGYWIAASGYGLHVESMN